LEKSSWNTDVADAVSLIAQGRKKHFEDGKAEEGLQQFKQGSILLKKAFGDVTSTGDVELVLRCEYLFLRHEIAFGRSKEKRARVSAEKALEVIQDAFRVVDVVKDSVAYKSVDKAYPLNNTKWRYKGFPNDAFHIACKSHIARLNNGLSRYGISDIDIDLITMRIDALKAIEDIYCGLQETALK
jgi:hypothetical protein